jgi:hypothetical protein
MDAFSMGQDRPLPDFEGDVMLTPGQVPASDLDGSDVPEPEPTSDENIEFPDEVEQDVTGLMFLGSLSESFELLGHRFTIKTLRAGEELMCAQIVKEYEDTLAQGKAFAIAQVAASIVTVDGRELVKSLGPEDTLMTLRQKFDFIRTRWYWPVIEMIYGHYSGLVVRQAIAYEAYEGKSSASRMMLMPLPGSRSAKGF